MAKTHKVRRLNDSKSKVIAQNILKEKTEALPDYEEHVRSPIVIAKHIPEYRNVVFLNGRDPGYALDFHYASKTHPLKQYKLLHGFEHNLPVEVIEHLEGCSEPQYGYRRGMDGHPEMYVISRKFIFQLRNPPKKVA